MDERTGSLRKQPVQQRSRARLATILRAAEQLVVERGVEDLTMRNLAIQAGVPVGSVYQYFETREAVLDTIVATHGQGLVEMLREAATLADALTWPDVIDAAVARQCARLRSSPAYVAIWTGRALSREQQAQDDQDVDAIADLLEGVVASQEGLARSQALTTACRVATQAADSTIRLAFRFDPNGDAEVLAQLRPMVVSYLGQVIEGLRDAGAGRDPDAASGPSTF